ncbi:hypothetical protein YC2023_053966 [Brassica napus]
MFDKSSSSSPVANIPAFKYLLSMALTASNIVPSRAMHNIINRSRALKKGIMHPCIKFDINI